MKKFKGKPNAIKKADGGVLEDVKRRSARAAAAKLEGLNDLSANTYAANDEFMRNALRNRVLGTTPSLPTSLQSPASMRKEYEERLKYGTPGPVKKSSAAPKMGRSFTAPISTFGEGDEVEMQASPNPLLAGSEGFVSSDVMNLPMSTAGKGGAGSAIEDAMYSAAKNAQIPTAALPKTKSGMKKFMDEYGKFIALGAMAGTGGKAGRIAAPIIAALPGLIGMMKKKKSSGGEPPKKSEGGAIRKFKGGSMKGNTMDSTLTPKYAKGGDMPKGMSKGKMGKAAGEMPQHKKMAMGKPTPQSMGQKFAKGGAAKYASGGMCKGYGIAKKIRPTGPMN